jgi:hypothetical protein
MADNVHKYGFRFFWNQSGGKTPPNPIEYRVASAYASSEGSSTPVLSIGDPVALTTDGTVIHAVDGGAPSQILGVIVGCRAAVDSNGRARPCSFVPRAQAYTLDRDATKVLVVPFGRHVWEIDVLNNGSVDTYAEYEALNGSNCDFAYNPGTINGQTRANPVLDLTSPGSTTANFRIIRVSPTAENQDFSGANVKLLVMVNEGQEPMLSTTGI